jgi:hypothetical protein
MSGQLVGEVLDAREAGRLDDLSPPTLLALIAIAEKCHGTTRQGSVRMSRIQAVMGQSRTTAWRAVRKLTDRGLVRMVKRGYRSHGEGHATVYELARVHVSANMKHAPTDVHVSNPDVHVSNSASACFTLGETNDGLNDGLNDGKEPPYPTKRQTAPFGTPPDGRGKALAKLNQLKETARSADAYRIAEAFSASLPTPIETGLLGDIGVQIDNCLNAGISAPAIAAGLQAWTQSDSWSPTQIPRFVHKANNGQPVATSDQRVAQIQALKAKFANREVTP